MSDTEPLAAGRHWASPVPDHCDLLRDTALLAIRVGRRGCEVVTQPDPHEITLFQPATGFTEAFLLGNGTLGASVHGHVGVERIDLNLDTLWSGGPTAVAPDHRSHSVFQALRSAIETGAHAEADVAARRLQGTTWSQSYQPLGALHWEWTTDGRPRRYTRRLSLVDAEARIDADDAWSSLFVSAADGVLVGLCTGNTDGSLRFSSTHPHTERSFDDGDGVRWLLAEGRAPTQVLPDYVDHPEPVQYGTDDIDDKGTVAAGMGWALAVAETTGPAGSRLVIAAADSGFRGWSERPFGTTEHLVDRARERVAHALRRGYDDLRQRHRESHQELYSRGGIDLSGSRNSEAAAAAQYFNLGRYLLISSSRPGSQAANLQGIWNVDTRPAWSSNYTLNINTPMNYWGAEVANLPELHEPLLDLARDLAQAGQQTAANLYQATGAAAHHNTDIWRLTTPVPGEPEWSNWPSGLAWLSSHFAERGAFLGESESIHDAELAVTTAAAEFLDSLLVPSPQGLIVSPSTSPENTYIVGDERFAVTSGATMDQEFALSALEHLHSLELRGGNTEAAERLSNRVRRLARPGIDGDGLLTEWVHSFPPAEPGHRHLSHLYGVFPGDRVTINRDPVSFHAARAALDLRLAAGTGYTSWSQAWVLALAARFTDAQLASRSLSTLINDLSSASLLGLHPHDAWASGVVFQIDGNLGAIAGISEMLLQSHDDAISILPALPSTWSSGSFFGLRARGGTTVGATWSQGRLETITLRGTPGAAVDVETHDEIEWQRESQSPTPSLKSQNPHTHRARWEVRLADEGSRRLSAVGIH